MDTELLQAFEKFDSIPTSDQGPQECWSPEDTEDSFNQRLLDSLAREAMLLSENRAIATRAFRAESLVHTYRQQQLHRRRAALLTGASATKLRVARRCDAHDEMPPPPQSDRPDTVGAWLAAAGMEGHARRFEAAGLGWEGVRELAGLARADDDRLHATLRVRRSR